MIYVFIPLQDVLARWWARRTPEWHSRLSRPRPVPSAWRPARDPHHDDVMGRGFQAIQGGVALSSERDVAAGPRNVWIRSAEPCFPSRKDAWI